MAIMIPDNIPSRASQGEKTLFGILRDVLPDDFYVYYEAYINKFFPDFIIIAPTFGLLILEVKGWYAGSIVSADHNYFKVRYQQDSVENIETCTSPLRQAYGYFGEIADLLKKYPILRQHEGIHEGKLAFPIGVGVVMSNIKLAQAEKENLTQLLPPPDVAYRDELLVWQRLSESDLIKRLKSMFKVYFPFHALTEDQISTIRGALHPSVIIKSALATPSSVPDGATLIPGSTILKTLDAQQEREATKLGSGHRLLNGVAGSGKTIILLSRARELAKIEGKRILLVCFNITLAAYLRSLLHKDDNNPQCQNVDVMHFHDWAQSIMGNLPNLNVVNDAGEDFDYVMGTKLLEKIQGMPVESKWDCILIDEAHTFDPSWFKCCVSALKDPEDSDLLVVYDGNQRLYNKEKFTWSSVGIRAIGRSKSFKKNYRNTQEILTAAWSVVEGIQTVEGETTDDIEANIVKPDTALRTGKRPVSYLSESRSIEAANVVCLIKSLLQKKYQPEDIAIIYRNNGIRNQPAFQDLREELKQENIDSYWVTKNKDTKLNYSTKTPGVRILTAQSALGLEFKVVIIIWLEQFADCYNTEVLSSSIARRLLYVAMTRATEELYLFGSKNVLLIDQLRQSGHFDLNLCSFVE
jgi:superfamily I DNA and RNA helicase